MTLTKLLDDFLRGDKKALARLITLIEDRCPEIEEVLGRLFPKIGSAHRIGITGPPGSGKSTLVDLLSILAVEGGLKVAVLAVDPSSPFTGGALLGDRYRMTRATERGVFIRSLATRGSLGGLSEAATQVADLLDAYGFDIVFLETIGVGQSELDIMDAADTVTVVLVPESGDAIQAMKAGLMEIADLFAINKADRSGADRFENELKSILQLAPQNDRRWKVPVLRSVATRGEGVREIFDKILEHRRFLEREGLWKEKRRKRIKYEIEHIIKNSLWQDFCSKGSWKENLERCVESVNRGEETPYSAAIKLLGELGSDG